MSSSARVEFIQHVKMALNSDDPGRRSLDDITQNEPSADDLRLLEKIANRGKKSHMTLLERLVEAGKLVNVGVIVEKDADSAAALISKIAAEKCAEWGDQKSVVAWDHPLVNRLGLAASLLPLDIPVYFSDWQPGTADRSEVFRKHAENAFIGITAADHCIAETATLTMKTRSGQPRCVSLLPSIHIALIRPEQILANLNELYTLLKWNPVERAEGITRCMTFITGPSKTADIEATLVHGAHGPRELYIIVLTG
ncbi:lactate utilization protein C [Desulfosarcina sp.]|uniref:LutC/YkgG family protein n=1 Tax=Desulfosarcina sp. TaxID=2027861 RepID=UPI00356557DC